MIPHCRSKAPPSGDHGDGDVDGDGGGDKGDKIDKDVKGDKGDKGDKDDDGVLGSPVVLFGR